MKLPDCHFEYNGPYYRLVFEVLIQFINHMILNCETTLIHTVEATLECCIIVWLSPQNCNNNKTLQLSFGVHTSCTIIHCASMLNLANLRFRNSWSRVAI